MTPSRPYLIRAIHEWIVDNGFTPQIVVDAAVEGVCVPAEHVQDGHVVLNISATAVRSLLLGNEAVEFDARFSGSPYHVVVPTNAVVAVLARESGRGMSFPSEDEAEPAERSGAVRAGAAQAHHRQMMAPPAHRSHPPGRRSESRCRDCG